MKNSELFKNITYRDKILIIECEKQLRERFKDLKYSSQFAFFISSFMNVNNIDKKRLSVDRFAKMVLIYTKSMRIKILPKYI